VPTRGLYVIDSQLDELPAVIDEWLVEAGPVLHAAVARTRDVPTA
jgi:hypothetical protein